MSHVAVVGAGVIGCATALELVRSGLQATVIDRHGDVGHGTTAASCGIVRRFYSNHVLTAMAHESVAIWSGWREYLGTDDPERGLARFEQPGMLLIPPAIDDGLRAIVERMRSLGIDVELLSADDMAARFGFLDPASHWPVRRPEDPTFGDATGRPIAGAVFEHGAGYVVSPALATHNLRVAAEREGAVFRLGRGVTAIERRDRGGFTLRTDGGATLEADVVVNAAGPHSSAVNRMAGVELGIEIRPLRREVHAVANPEYSDAGAGVPVCGDIDSGVYFRPESCGRDLIVGAIEPPCDTLEWVDDPDRCEPQITAGAFERQVLRLMKRFPAVGLGPRRGIASLYDVTLLDWNPVLDRTDVPGVYVAVGTSGSSFKTAPVIGRLMTALIGACEAGHDHDADPVQVHLPRIGYDVDLGFFSRLRAAHPTTGTVLG